VISIREVAKRSGVSPSTVSRVLSGSARVDDSTRKRVEEVIRETGYRPNINAQSLGHGAASLSGWWSPTPMRPLRRSSTLLRRRRTAWATPSSSAILRVIRRRSGASSPTFSPATLMRSSSPAFPTRVTWRIPSGAARFRSSPLTVVSRRRTCPRYSSTIWPQGGWWASFF
jgi:transcriptional regulator with XRE-family HTH domain